VFNNLRTIDREKLIKIVSAEIAGGIGDGPDLEDLDDLTQVGAAGGTVMSFQGETDSGAAGVSCRTDGAARNACGGFEGVPQCLVAVTPLTALIRNLSLLQQMGFGKLLKIKNR